MAAPEMSGTDARQATNGRWRKVLYALAAIPALYPALLYVWVAACTLLLVPLGGDPGPTEGSAYWWACWGAIWVTFIQWPFYLAWALTSRELSRRQRVAWAIIILAANILAMPYFLWCKYRRCTRERLLAATASKRLRAYLAR